MSLSCTAQQLTKENAAHWAKGKIANNIRQCSCFHLLSLPKEKYLYIVYEVVCLCYIPSRQCFEEMRFFREARFSLQSIHFKKSWCFLQAGGCFWASHMFFQEEIFLWRLDCLKNNMCYLRCVLRSKVRYSCLSFIMVTFLQAEAVFFKGWTLNLKLQSHLRKQLNSSV